MKLPKPIPSFEVDFTPIGENLELNEETSTYLLTSNVSVQLVCCAWLNFTKSEEALLDIMGS